MDVEAIRTAVETGRSAIHTAQLGTVTSVSGSFAQVKLGLRPVPTLEDGVYTMEKQADAWAQVIWPGGNGGQLVTGVVPGDTVLVVFLEYDPDGGDLRQHSIGNAVCIPCVVGGAAGLTIGAGPSYDGLALASYLNKLIGVLKGVVLAGTLADATTIKAAVVAAFPSVPVVLAPFATPATPAATSGSTLVKVAS